MSDLLIRGLSREVHRQIQKIAEEENLSVNQLLVRLLVHAVRRTQEKKEEQGRRREAFRRLEEMREKLHKKYGKFDDSTKLIREDRDSR